MKKIFFALLLAGAMSSCQDYLNVQPKGPFIPKTMQDYEELSSNPSYKSNSNAYLERLSDGIFVPDANVKSGMNSASSKTYIWAAEYYKNTEADGAWNGNYNNIYNTNIILQNLDAVTDGTVERKNIVKGNALCNRAYAYLNLVLLYAPYYNEATAATDLAVPLVTVPDLEAKSKRATVKEVYDLILSDLTAALPLLPEKGQNVYRNSKATVNGILARVYLNMGDYEKAAINAKEALKYNTALFDFNTVSFQNPDRPALGWATRELPYQHTEMLSYYVTSFGSILTNTYISPDLLQVVDPKDLRLKFGWSPSDRQGVPVKEPYPIYINTDLNYNIAVPEMMLIVAENHARAGRVNEAISQLNTLRKKRFAPADYKDLTAANKDEALKLVINERRIELFGKGLRWYDMKRLDKDPMFAKVYKRANTYQEFKLEKGSPNFVSQIPANVMLLNPEILPNPR
ncbi:RagB/SusD family nutrient uptake outer membrane protein [Sphingobacterium yanglingense]|uniref:SusD-like starch-binding protein associating with outer membrane n=1 Tax=Sphingobacterium yanglingense TaxID=1437280 RepID=A0A4R6WK96_9SPHI|nr:RagB/SusD family nutrient uptake outer membrane protein [Sphingobacterium yanglingense]TDQ79132.1 SusD-like starch-binding protein associating with outer membrane [Sphingobacterium yanglingense]